MYRIINANLEQTAVKKTQYPIDDMMEIAFAGRSNVGKSSLINFLTNRKKLARVSGSPGKTRVINFYRINDEFRIVDLPGYGYARVSKNEQEKWGNMIEGYLLERENLKIVALLVDIRHKPSAQDVQMYEYLKYYNLHGLVVATKLDKISRNDIIKNTKIIRETLGMDEEDLLIPVSVLKKLGIEELVSNIVNILGVR